MYVALHANWVRTTHTHTHTHARARTHTHRNYECLNWKQRIVFLFDSNAIYDDIRTKLILFYWTCHLSTFCYEYRRVGAARSLLSLYRTNYYDNEWLTRLFCLKVGHTWPRCYYPMLHPTNRGWGVCSIVVIWCTTGFSSWSSSFHDVYASSWDHYEAILG